MNIVWFSQLWVIDDFFIYSNCHSINHKNFKMNCNCNLNLFIILYLLPFEFHFRFYNQLYFFWRSKLLSNNLRIPYIYLTMGKHTFMVSRILRIYPFELKSFICLFHSLKWSHIPKCSRSSKSTYIMKLGQVKQINASLIVSAHLSSASAIRKEFLYTHYIFFIISLSDSRVPMAN